MTNADINREIPLLSTSQKGKKATIIALFISMIQKAPDEWMRVLAEELAYLELLCCQTVGSPSQEMRILARPEEITGKQPAGRTRP